MTSVSIVTVSFNSASTIADCIRSVQSQTVDVEHVIVDGHSVDGTMDQIEVLRNYSMKVISEPDNGIYDAINKGINLCTGDVIGILNSDDLLASPTVAAQIQKSISVGVDGCYGDLVYVKRDNTERIVRRWKAGEFRIRKFYWGWMPPHPTLYLRRQIYDRVGLYRTDHGSAADYEFMIRALVCSPIRLSYIPDVLVRMRVGGISNRTLSARIRANIMDRESWRLNHLKPYPWTIVLKPLRKLTQFL